jgi:hypothetical protein
MPGLATGEWKVLEEGLPIRYQSSMEGAGAQASQTQEHARLGLPPAG